MKILSFDVGIKNLAYCILEDHLTEDSIEYKITDWNIIDLTDSPIEGFDDGVTNNKFLFGYKKLKVNELRDYLEKIKIQSNGNRGELIKKVESYLKENKLLKNRNSSKISVLDLGKTLYKKLDEMKPTLIKAQINEVVIENQPSLKNPTMKTVQMLLYSYFVMHGFISGELDTINNMKLIAARNKLNVYDGPDMSSLYNYKSQYNLTKKLSVEYCKHMLKHCNHKLESDTKEIHEKSMVKLMKFFTDSDKCDDLADCYLQGAFYLRSKHKHLPMGNAKIKAKEKEEAKKTRAKAREELKKAKADAKEKGIKFEQPKKEKTIKPKKPRKAKNKTVSDFF
jgi:hypothetical protein